jgi:hypothetical protein
MLYSKYILCPLFNNNIRECNNLSLKFKGVLILFANKWTNNVKWRSHIEPTWDNFPFFLCCHTKATDFRSLQQTTTRASEVYIWAICITLFTRALCFSPARDCCNFKQVNAKAKGVTLGLQVTILYSWSIFTVLRESAAVCTNEHQCQWDTYLEYMCFTFPLFFSCHSLWEIAVISKQMTKANAVPNTLPVLRYSVSVLCWQSNERSV